MIYNDFLKGDFAMKKTILGVICLALCVSIALASCAKKNDEVKDETNDGNAVVENQVSENEETKEEEKVLFEYDFTKDGAVLTAYLGGDELEEVVLEEKPVRMKKEKQKKTVTEEVTNADGTVTTVEKQIEETVVVPVEYTLVGVEAGVFMNNTTIKKVVIPDTVLEVGQACFQGCTALEEVVLPAPLKKIGDMMFYGCESLTTLNIPESVEEIGLFVFSDFFNETPWYANLTEESVIVGDGILLKYNGYAQNLTYGDEVKSIAYYAFMDTPVKTIKLTNAVDEVSDIHELAFYRSDVRIALPETSEIVSSLKMNGIKVDTYEVAE